MTRREQIALFGLVFVRALMMFARVFADTRRFWNFEEAYNATVAWAVAHGMWPEIFDLQYRSFCGGCTVVAAIAAPLIAVSDTFVAWKTVAVLWAIATMLCGFAAVDRWAGRPAAWAFALIMAVPPLGGLDLSLMLWGNHQETALLGMIALLLVNRPVAAGFVLGASVWFARTALYQVVVLAPLFVWISGWRVGLGLGAGLLLLAIPSANGDAGFYRMNDAFGVAWDEAGERVASLLGPQSLAKRLFHPLKAQSLGAAIWLGAAALGLLARGRARVFVAWALAYSAAYCLTNFPIFIVSAKSPVNNIRYHGPWIFVLTALIAVGVGRAWAWRRWAGAAVLAAVLLVDAHALTRMSWEVEPCVLGIRASWPAKLATVAQSRLPLARLAKGATDPRLNAALQTMYGFRIGEDDPPDFFSRIAGSPYRLRGYALERRSNGAASTWNTWLDQQDPEVAREMGRGVAIGGNFSRTSHGSSANEDPPVFDGYRSARPCWLCAAAGPLLLRGCADDHDCVVNALADRPAEVAWGVGYTYARPDRSWCAIEAFAEGLPAEFKDGALDPMAGTPDAPR